MASHVPTAETTVEASRKRKGRESSYSPRAQSPAVPGWGQSGPGPVPARADAVRNNRLLAGVLAHEFLTKGTLFGKRWETSGYESANNKNNNSKAVVAGSVQPVSGPTAESARSKPPSSYANVSYLLKANGARIPGVVNPTQLARWLQM
ncbi:hypothetical protein Cni_G07458 [Canna indica]|uniref:Embryo sac development arrest 6 n=1 Tax=Canna indica TaxID=4628 RepID=A0AAQ3JYR5_9LILI|nr:hypothetical protein Cni_G07458 [Canna indica]